MQKKVISVLMIVSAFHAVLSLATNIFLARYLGVDALGKYNYAVTLGTFAYQLVGFGVDQILVNEYVRGGRRAVTKAYLFKMINYCILIIISVVLYVLLNKTIGLLSCAIAINALNFQVVYEIKGEPKKYSYIFFVEKLIFGIGLGIYLIGGGQNLVTIFIIYFFCACASIFFQAHDSVEIFDRTGVVPIDKKLFFVGLSVLVTGLSKYTFGGFSRILIKENLGFAALGLFTLIWQFVSLVSIYTQQIISVVRLNIAEKIKRLEYEEIKRQSIYLMCASITPAVGFIAMAYLFRNIEYFSGIYLSVNDILPWVAIYMFVAALDSFLILYYIPLKLELVALKAYAFFSIICFLLLMSNQLPSNLVAYILVITLTHFFAICYIVSIIWQNINNFKSN